MTLSRIRDTTFDLRWNIFEMSNYFCIPVAVLSKALNNPILVAILMRPLGNLKNKVKGTMKRNKLRIDLVVLATRSAAADGPAGAPPRLPQ